MRRYAIINKLLNNKDCVIKVRTEKCFIILEFSSMINYFNKFMIKHFNRDRNHCKILFSVIELGIFTI